YLDALAAHRRALGLPAVSYAWGLWAERSDMTGNLAAADLARLARDGIRPLSSADGLALFDAARTSGEPLVVPVQLDPAALAQRPGAVPALLTGLVEQSAAAAPAVARRTAQTAAEPQDAADALRRRLTGLTPAEQQRVVLRMVRDHAATVLGHGTANAVDPERGFLELGFDSLTAVELRNRLNAATGLRLPPTLIFDYPTPAVLAGHLREEIAPPAAAAGTDEPTGADRAAPGEAGDRTGSLTGELDRLEAVLTASARPDDATREAVTSRLKALLAGWENLPAAAVGPDASGPAGPAAEAASEPATGAGPAPAAGPGADPADVAEQLESVTADELFKFIDAEFGGS
ncbi:beta-ketoacyl reductase, partial [Streptomyces sp. NPDC018031]|uniref:beta-ketoacyl reductase n=1 Tax=Streptomyces sp. NPDC018031 TaxID=3365033 RepID=UPI00379EAA21